ncbi:hypothetical protein BHYA_0105g00130 [Botrytis hyacinthi]|uniref:Uncharacterized protein n=1 Tax=Botrytis hyacinthi TaxID=278943 RepID=A0A4Z1GNT0_9HELO|nr:hypothetical protein BHYA_0105g00130 [Botrytis hyacinthi]
MRSKNGPEAADSDPSCARVYHLRFTANGPCELFQAYGTLCNTVASKGELRDFPPQQMRGSGVLVYA